MLFVEIDWLFWGGLRYASRKASLLRLTEESGAWDYCKGNELPLVGSFRSSVTFCGGGIGWRLHLPYLSINIQWIWLIILVRESIVG